MNRTPHISRGVYEKAFIGLLLVALLAHGCGHSNERRGRPDEYPEDIKRLIAAVRSKDATACLDAERAYPRRSGLQCEFEYSRADEADIINAAVAAKGKVRTTACYLLSLTGGYRADTAMLKVLENGTSDEVIAAVFALQYRRGDPRIGPALVDAFKRMLEQGEEEATRQIAYLIGNIGYGPAAETLIAALRDMAQGRWWHNEEERHSVPALLGVLSSLSYDAAPSLYNSILGEVFSAKASNEDMLPLHLRGIPEALFLAKTGLWSEQTVDIFASLIEAPEERVVGYSSRNIPAIVSEGSVHEVSRRALRSAFPWTHEDWNPDDYRHLVNRAQGLNSLYVEQLRVAHPAGPMALCLVAIVRMRTIEHARPVIESWLKSTDVPEYRLVALSQSAAELGSWGGIITLLRIARSDSDSANLSCKTLRDLTGYNFRKNWDVWDWWLERAKARLHWDVHTNSWQPADKWEALQIEALAKLEESAE